MAMTFETTTLRSHTPRAPRVSTTSYVPQRDLGAATGSRRTTKPIALMLAVVFAAIAVVGFGSDAAASNEAGVGSEAVAPAAPATSTDASGVHDSIEVYVVKPGDTLWEIATDLAQPDEDVRLLVDALEEIAGGSQLDIGQRLIIDHLLLRS